MKKNLLRKLEQNLTTVDIKNCGTKFGIRYNACFWLCVLNSLEYIPQFKHLNCNQLVVKLIKNIFGSNTNVWTDLGNKNVVRNVRDFCEEHNIMIAIRSGTGDNIFKIGNIATSTHICCFANTSNVHFNFLTVIEKAHLMNSHIITPNVSNMAKTASVADLKAIAKMEKREERKKCEERKKREEHALAADLKAIAKMEKREEMKKREEHALAADLKAIAKMEKREEHALAADIKAIAKMKKREENAYPSIHHVLSLRY